MAGRPLTISMEGERPVDVTFTGGPHAVPVVSAARTYHSPPEPAQAIAGWPCTIFMEASEKRPSLTEMAGPHAEPLASVALMNIRSARGPPMKLTAGFPATISRLKRFSILNRVPGRGPVSKMTGAFHAVPAAPVARVNFSRFIEPS